MACEAIATIRSARGWVWIMALAGVRAEGVGARGPVIVAQINVLGALVDIDADLPVVVLSGL